VKNVGDGGDNRNDGCITGIAALVLFIGLALALAFCDKRADAAEPSPVPSPDSVPAGGSEISGGVIVIAVLLFIGAMAVVYKNMKSHENY
jgi:hypothetical protein